VSPSVLTLLAEERGVILLCIEDLTKKLSNADAVKAEGHNSESKHDGTTLVDF